MSVHLNSQYNRTENEENEIDYLNKESIQNASTPMYKNNNYKDNNMNDLISFFSTESQLDKNDSHHTYTQNNSNREVLDPELKQDGLFSHFLDTIYSTTFSFLQLISIKNRNLFFPGLKSSIYTLTHGLNIGDGSLCISCYHKTRFHEKVNKQKKQS